MNCRPGDMAVVIAAVNQANIGRIVKVLRPYDAAADKRWKWIAGPAWIIQGHTLMTWANETDLVLDTVGPALDIQLRPIRGTPPRRSKAIRERLPTEQLSGVTS